MRYYSFLTEIQSLAPTRNPESEVGDPIGGVDAKTEKMRRYAKRTKAESEVIAAQAQLAKTKSDAAKIAQQIQNDQEEQANQELDRQRQMTAQQQQPQQDPTQDPNAQLR